MLSAWGRARGCSDATPLRSALATIASEAAWPLLVVFAQSGSTRQRPPPCAESPTPSVARCRAGARRRSAAPEPAWLVEEPRQTINGGEYRPQLTACVSRREHAAGTRACGCPEGEGGGSDLAARARVPPGVLWHLRPRRSTSLARDAAASVAVTIPCERTAEPGAARGTRALPEALCLTGPRSVRPARTAFR